MAMDRSLPLMRWFRLVPSSRLMWLQSPPLGVCAAKAALHAQVSNEIRRSVASGLGPWVTDDVVADCLMDLQHSGSAVSVWTDPVLLVSKAAMSLPCPKCLCLRDARCSAPV